MKVELQDHIATTVEGRLRNEQQWRIFIDGVLVGYLPYGDGSRIMPLYKVFPYGRIAEIIAGCESERARHGKPSKVLDPYRNLEELEKVLSKLEDKEEEESDES